MTIRLSREEAWAALSAGHTGILTTLRADGVPISLPVWFVVLEEHAQTKKVARKSGERWAELRSVHLTGRARLVAAPDLLERVHAALTAKDERFRTKRAAMPDGTRRYYEAAPVVVEIVPDERILTWDNSRLALRS
jgi:nitroimidazol reductase NimA-like FMN-containing flavoprotein (pyridoxamine 5'-phosphate oxidase superfamily)